ncbi:hypothetical protein Tco_1275462 [Tanacetum coccineum]
MKEAIKKKNEKATDIRRKKDESVHEAVVKRKKEQRKGSDTADFLGYTAKIGTYHKQYPTYQEVLSQIWNLLDLKLETEEESTMALELIKFVKQQLEEFEDSDDDDLAKSDHEEAERV